MKYKIVKRTYQRWGSDDKLEDAVKYHIMYWGRKWSWSKFRFIEDWKWVRESTYATYDNLVQPPLERSTKEECENWIESMLKGRGSTLQDVKIYESREEKIKQLLDE
jgi:hypothetical protein